MTIETGVTYKINLSRKKTLIERRVGIKAQGSGRRALGAWSRVQGEEHQLMAERYLVIGDSSYGLFLHRAPNEVLNNTLTVANLVFRYNFF